MSHQKSSLLTSVLESSSDESSVPEDTENPVLLPEAADKTLRHKLQPLPHRPKISKPRNNKDYVKQILSEEDEVTSDSDCGDVSSDIAPFKSRKSPRYSSLATDDSLSSTDSPNFSDTPSTSKLVSSRDTLKPSAMASKAKALLGVKRKNKTPTSELQLHAKKKSTTAGAMRGATELAEAGNDENAIQSTSELGTTPKRYVAAIPKLLQSEDIMVQLNTTLNNIVNRMEKWESKMKSVEKHFSTSKCKKQISSFLRSEVRRMYQFLCEENEDFPGYNTNLGISFNDKENNIITEKLVKDVKAANASFERGQIRAAAYTYYRSLCQEASLERNGKKGIRNQIRRRRERLVRKMNSRLSIVKKSDLQERDKMKWIEIINVDFMSSEESEGEDGELVTKILPWRALKVTKFFKVLDDFNEKEKSSQSKRQSKKRILSDRASERNIPTASPSWALIKQQ